MSYQLNEEQKMIQAMVRDLAREVILPGAAERDKTKEFPSENIKNGRAWSYGYGCAD